MLTVSWVDAEELCAQSVEKMPKATDCLVVVAGVKAGGSAFDSATAAAWWFGRGAVGCGCKCASLGLLANLMFAGGSDIVGLFYWSCCRSMHGHYATQSEL